MWKRQRRASALIDCGIRACAKPKSRNSMSASVGTDRDFLWGFMLGLFVGFLMLMWVWMPTIPHKQKLGILTGICLQLALGMLKNAEHARCTVMTILSING
jgi:uncharacterized membrane protein YccC